VPGPQNERYIDKGRLIRPIVKLVKTHALVLLDGGDEIVVRAGDEGVRFPLVSGTRCVAWSDCHDHAGASTSSIH